MDKKKYQDARKRVKAKKEFYEHLSTYLVMAAFFFFLNFITAPGSWWFYWPMLGWGIAVLFHYIGVFGVPGIGHLDDDWEKRALKKELERMDSGYNQEDWLDLEDLEKKKKEKKPQKRWDEEDLV